MLPRRFPLVRQWLGKIATGRAGKGYGGFGRSQRIRRRCGVLYKREFSLEISRAISPGKLAVESEQTEVQLILRSALQQRYDEAIAVRSIKANNQDFRPVLAKASILNQRGKPSRQSPV